jgi:hypothetical protein
VWVVDEVIASCQDEALARFGGVICAAHGRIMVSGDLREECNQGSENRIVEIGV